MKKQFMRMLALTLSLIMALSFGAMAETVSSVEDFNRDYLADYLIDLYNESLQQTEIVEAENGDWTNYNTAAFPDARISLLLEVLGQVFDLEVTAVDDNDGCEQLLIDSESLGLADFLLQSGETGIVTGDSEDGYIQVSYEELMKLMYLIQYMNSYNMNTSEAVQLYDYFTGSDYWADMEKLGALAAFEINRFAQLAVNNQLVTISENGEMTIKADVKQALDVIAGYLRDAATDSEALGSLCSLKLFSLLKLNQAFRAEEVSAMLVSAADSLASLDLDSVQVQGELYLHVDVNGAVEGHVNYGVPGYSIALTLNGSADQFALSFDMKDNDKSLSMKLDSRDETVFTLVSDLDGNLDVSVKINDSGAEIDCLYAGEYDTFNAAIIVDQHGVSLAGNYQDTLDRTQTELMMSYDAYLDYFALSFDSQDSRLRKQVNVELSEDYQCLSYYSFIGGRIESFLTLTGSEDCYILDAYSYRYGILNASILPYNDSVSMKISFDTLNGRIPNLGASIIYSPYSDSMYGGLVTYSRGSEGRYEFSLSSDALEVSAERDGMKVDFFVKSAMEGKDCVIDVGANITEDTAPDTVIPALEARLVFNPETLPEHTLDIKVYDKEYASDAWTVIAEIRSLFSGKTWMYNSKINGSTTMLTGLASETATKSEFVLQGMIDNQMLNASVGMDQIVETGDSLSFRPFIDVKMGAESWRYELPIVLTYDMGADGTETAKISGELKSIIMGVETVLGKLVLESENFAGPSKHVDGTELSAEDLLLFLQSSGF